MIDSVEGLSADDIPSLLPSLPQQDQNTESILSENEHSLTESLDSISELPNTSGQQLQHLVKTRPKRTKTRAPTRPMLRNDIQQPIDSLELGEGLDVFFRPTTPTTPLISPTSDDSSLNTFPPINGSPNLSLSSQPSIQQDIKINNNGCNSPMLKTLLEPTPRSISSDNLEKFSPLTGRRSQGDTPLTASPLVRRNTNESIDDNKKNIIVSGSSTTTLGQETSDNNCPSNIIKSVKIAKANFEEINDGKFSRINKSVPPVPTSKPRPWSMSTDRKSGEIFYFYKIKTSLFNYKENKY